MTRAAWAIAAALVAVSASPARAEDSVAGTYDVKLDEVSTSCSPPPVALANKTIRIDVKSGNLTVNLDTVPQMFGTAAKNGKITAKTKKVLPTTVGGLDGMYTIAGHVAADATVDLVLVADYSRSDTKKPYCTQSWSITGKRAAAK